MTCDDHCRVALLASVLMVPLALFPRPAGAAPATEAQMTLYTRIAALNACIARASGVEFDMAVGIAGETIAQLIQGQHGGAIAQVGRAPLRADELRKGSINTAVLGAAELCPREVPPEVMKRVQDALRLAGPAPNSATRP